MCSDVHVMWLEELEPDALAMHIGIRAWQLVSDVRCLLTLRHDSISPLTSPMFYEHGTHGTRNTPGLTG